MFSRSFLLAAGAAAGILFLSGCGAANSLINNNIPAIDNLLGLNGQTTDAVVGSGRVAISGSGVKEVTFADRSLSQADKLKFVKFTQNVGRSVTISVPTGAALPTQFVLTNITLTLSARDDAPHSVSVSGTVGGPLTFVQVGTTNQYQTVDDLNFADLQIKDNFSTFRDIVTTAPSPNFASGKISLDTDTNQLPSGSVITFIFIGGKAKIGL